MKQKIIRAITDFIFVEDIPQKSDIILMYAKRTAGCDFIEAIGRRED